MQAEGYKMEEQVFIENGIGYVEIEFLGETLVVGCIEGEVDQAARNAARFEINTGEVLKAVSGIDERRAVLMAGILAMERVEELELDLKRNTVDRSDSRIIGTPNREKLNLLRALDDLSDLVRASNQFAVSEPEEHEQILSELEAGKGLLSSTRISPSTLKALLIGVLTFLSMKFIDQPIGEAASYAWETLKAFMFAHSSN